MAEKTYEGYRFTKETEKTQTTTETVTENKDTNMPPTTKEKLKNTGTQLASAIKVGAAQGAIGEVNRQIIAKLEEKMGDSYPDVLRTEAGRLALQALIPATVLTVCEFDVTNKIPQKAAIRSGAEMALTNAAAGGAASLVQILLEELGPVLSTYANAAKAISADEVEADNSFFAEGIMQREAEYAFEVK